MMHARLRVWCAAVSILCLGLIALTLAGAIAPWIWTSYFREHWGAFATVRFDLQALGTAARLGGLAVGLVPALLAAWGLWRLGRVFRAFAREEAFSSPSVAHFRAFAWSVLGYALVQPVAVALQGLILTAAASGEGAELALTFTGDEFRLVVIGVLLVSLSLVFRYGEELAEEQAHLL